MNDELALLDATAQAALVRDGEASPVELVDAAIKRIEASNGELNAVIHPLFEQAREAALGELPDGPFRGVPFLLKDLGAAFAGDPLHMGMRFLKEAGFRSPLDTYLAQRFREAGFVTVGKTNTPELGIVPTTEPDAYGATPQPLGPLSLAGRLERRVRSRGRIGHGAAGSRQRRRRLDPHPSERLWAGRPEADPATDHRRAPRRRFHVRTERGAGGFEIGARHRRGPRRRPRPGAW